VNITYDAEQLRAHPGKLERRYKQRKEEEESQTAKKNAREHKSANNNRTMAKMKHQMHHVIQQCYQHQVKRTI